MPTGSRSAATFYQPASIRGKVVNLIVPPANTSGQKWPGSPGRTQFTDAVIIARPSGQDCDLDHSFALVREFPRGGPVRPCHCERSEAISTIQDKEIAASLRSSQ
jgi:hypothetical protein